MKTIASGISLADLEFQGLPRIIATALMTGPDGIAIVDPGPASTLPVLKRHLASLGATVQDVTALLVTHIHLDHAGASGTLVRENPRIRVHVHQVGAPHMADPSKLVASAARLYGEDMERLWGEVAPVAPSAIVPLTGRDAVAAGGRSWAVAHTPGHASHHVSFFSADSGIAFVGDTAGVQLRTGGFVLPPTPPPDIDIPLWFTSLATIEQWRPQTLFLTHFGTADAVPAHLAELRDHLQLSERLAREALAHSDDDQGREAWFIDHLRQEMGRRMGAAELQAYELAGRFDLNWRGLARYVAKRTG